MLDDRITDSRATTSYGRDLPGPIEVEDIAEESLRRRHEVQDVRLRPLVIFALIMLATAIVIHIGLWWALRVWADDPLVVEPQIPPAAVTPPAAPGPGIEPFPRAERDALLTEQATRLNTYGWVDRETGVVHIPLERAMELLVERGLPAREDGPAPNFGLDPAYELESEGGQGLVPLTQDGIEVGAEEGAAVDEND